MRHPKFAKSGLSNNQIPLNDLFDLYAFVVGSVCLCDINYYNILYRYAAAHANVCSRRSLAFESFANLFILCNKNNNN